MAKNESQFAHSSSTPDPAPGHRPKKPYEPPRILSREPLEAMAATCTPPTGKAAGVCGTARS